MWENKSSPHNMESFVKPALNSKAHQLYFSKVSYSIYDTSHRKVMGQFTQHSCCSGI